jgi:hypothetical protein
MGVLAVVDDAQRVRPVREAVMIELAVGVRTVRQAQRGASARAGAHAASTVVDAGDAVAVAERGRVVTVLHRHTARIAQRTAGGELRVVVEHGEAIEADLNALPLVRTRCAALRRAQEARLRRDLLHPVRTELGWTHARAAEAGPTADVDQ